MGDVGSTFCGFTIAALSLIALPPARAAVLPVVVLALWPFLFDAGITLFNRIARRENVLEPHQTHLYQRLALAGLELGDPLLLPGSQVLQLTVALLSLGEV